MTVNWRSKYCSPAHIIENHFFEDCPAQAQPKGLFYYVRGIAANPMRLARHCLFGTFSIINTLLFRKFSLLKFQFPFVPLLLRFAQ